MSTVLYHDGFLYADTQQTQQLSDGNVKLDYYRKLCQINDSIIGFTGNVATVKKFLLWFENGCKYSDNVAKSKDFTCLEINGDTLNVWITKPLKNRLGKPKYYFYVFKSIELSQVEFNCIGSGNEYAAGAFEICNDPVKSIKVAAQYDFYTNSIIECMGLKDRTVKAVTDNANNNLSLFPVYEVEDLVENSNEVS